MQSRLGKFLVKSPWLRTPYGVVKAVAFCLLAIQHGLGIAGSASGNGVFVAAQAAAWLAFGLCIVRGLPVLIEGPRVLLRSSQGSP
jgi:hypothetical protein